MLRSIYIYFIGHFQNFKSQCECESTRMVLYSNYFAKVYHSNELKISRTKHITVQNKNVKNVASPISYISHSPTNETHITHAAAGGGGVLYVYSYAHVILYFMRCILHTFKVSSGKFEANATSKERNFSICAVGKHTKTIKCHITS